MGFRLEFNVDGFNQVRNSDEVVNVLEEIAGYVVAGAEAGVRTSIDPGPAFTATTHHNPSRAVVVVATANIDGMIAEARNRALTRSIG